jgi:leader peptidase (prepilin peptidase)/N-methyltransferase
VSILSDTYQFLADYPGLAGLFFVMYGLILGSGATAAFYRLLSDDDRAGGARSECPKCGHVLSAVELIPVVSWIIQGGKCRHCGRAIHWRYPMIELTSAGLFWAVYMIFGLTAGLWCGLVAGLGLVLLLFLAV